MVGKKALANRAFLIDAWHNSVNANRPPKNRQELYDTAKASYAHIHDGADFTCSANDLAMVLHNLKEEYYKKPLDALRVDSSSAENDSAFLYAELKRVCDTMQERIIRNARILIGYEIEARLASIINENNEAKAKLDKAKELLKANNVPFDEADLSLSDKECTNSLELCFKRANEGFYSDYEQSMSLTKQGAKCLNLLLKQVVPVLDNSLEPFVNRLSILIPESVAESAAEIAPQSVGKADKLPSKQASLMAMPAKGQEPSTEAIKALDSSDNKPRAALPEQAGMLIYKQKSDDNEQLLIRVFR